VLVLDVSYVGLQWYNANVEEMYRLIRLLCETNSQQSTNQGQGFTTMTRNPTRTKLPTLQSSDPQTRFHI